MSEMKEVKIKEIIDFSKSLSNGSFFTKTLINKHPGNIPVYGASKVESEVSYGFVKDNLVIYNRNKRESNVKYFENCLTWNIDGSVAIFNRKGRFSLSEKVIPLIVYDYLKNYIDYDYLRYAILKTDDIKNFNFSNKAGKTKLGDILIKIPINSQNMYDLNKQKEFTVKYKLIEEEKKSLIKKQEELNNINITFFNIDKIANVKITDLLIPTLGLGKYTKEMCLKIPGDYPLFSGNTVEAFDYINEYMYDGKYLTWAKDGLAGYLMYHDGKFSITNHRGILIPNCNLDNIDLQYIKIILEPIFRKNIKGRLGLEGKNEYTTLSKDMIKNIQETIPIPVDDNGLYDLEKQKEIAQKLENINLIKKKILQELEILINIEVVI
jgi:hypothetical protein